MAEHVITKEEFTRILGDAKRHKEDAKEATGRHGQVVSQAVESYGLNTKAFNVIVGLAKKETTKQQEFLRAIILYADHAEMFDSIDGFDNIVEQMESIANRIRGRNSPAPADQDAADTVSGLVN